MIAWLLKKLLGLELPSHYLGCLIPPDLEAAAEQHKESSWS